MTTTAIISTYHRSNRKDHIYHTANCVNAERLRGRRYKRTVTIKDLGPEWRECVACQRITESKHQLSDLTDWDTVYVARSRWGRRSFHATPHCERLTAQANIKAGVQGEEEVKAVSPAGKRYGGIKLSSAVPCKMCYGVEPAPS